MKTYKLVIIALSLSSSFLYGQDKLILSNGSKILGNVFTSVSHDSVYVESDGYGFFIPRPLIKGVRFNRRKEFSGQPQFLQNNFSDDFAKNKIKRVEPDTFEIMKNDYLRFLTGLNMIASYSSEIQVFPQIIYGYKYNSLVNLAFFVRYNQFQTVAVFPFGLHYEYDLRTTKSSPFFYFEYGGSLAFGKLISNGPKNEARGGANYRIGAGHAIKFKNSDIRFSTGFISQKVNFDYEPNAADSDWLNYISSKTYYRFFISVGYSLY